MNEIQIFNNDLFGQVRGVVIDEKPYFVGKDIATVLGYSNPRDAISRHCKGVVKNDSFKEGGHSISLITEGDVYRLIFGSKLPKAEEFESWVVDELLPQLRKTGIYITESATPAAIDYQTKYGTRRIRKTFREANRIELDNLFKEFVELSKIERDAGRISNKDRIKCCDIIISELEDTVANDIVNMKAYEVLMIKDVIQTVLDQKQTWSNKMYGGKISNMNREIKNLKQQVEELTPPTRIYSTVYYSGFSNNYQYAVGSDGKLHRTHAYNNWIKNFPVEQVPTKEDYEIYENIDFTKPIEVELRFICKACFDVHNLSKSFIDMVFNRILGVDDSVVVNVKTFRDGTCDSYEDGQIIFSIYNI